MTPDDLATESIEAVLPGRPVRSYPALLSTEAEALAWARTGAEEGALVVADYQASPRGRGGLTWETHPGKGLGFSLVLRPDMPVEYEGWLYPVATRALADVAGPAAALQWPDEVWEGGARWAAVGVYAQLGPERVEWAVVTVLVERATEPRPDALATLVRAIEARYHAPAEQVLADYRAGCSTLGRQVRARLVPMGPDGPEVAGVARDALLDGALSIETDSGRRVAVRPGHLGVLETPGEAG